MQRLTKSIALGSLYSVHAIMLCLKAYTWQPLSHVLQLTWATVRIRQAVAIRLNTNTLFGPLFVLNRIRIEYSVQPCYKYTFTI